MRLTAVALLSAAVASAHPNPGDKLNKPPVHPNLDYLEAGLEEYLPETSYTLHEWNNGYIPEQCKKIVTGGVDPGTHFNPADIQTFDVKYADCGDPWVFCHHRNSNASIDTMARQFGKLPIQMRQWVRHVIDLPDKGRHAYEWDGTVTFFAAGEHMMTVIAHETGHSLDLSGAYPDRSLSNSDRWWREYDQDSHVPDPYSASNAIEDVAQNTVVAVHDVNVPGGYPGVEPGWAGIVHQLHLVEAEAREAGEGNSILIPGHNRQCTHRMPASKPVPIGGGGKRRGAAPDVSLRSGVEVIDTSGRQQKHSRCTMTW
ncbi:hypothetical protein V2A60_009709 [Cordyceps javanica]|uniref:Conidiation-specific protein n=1 Tax=Cordyceps javanica TaxID=43265 RepID=A0A545VV11_9HYPO|nr:conidiation-specific protein [Cordyceps javanica]TQW05559.1 conidiation-specific protein [Cordyceps javanica]